MAKTTWQRLGKREKQILAILRCSSDPLTTREVMNELRDEGDELAYTTVSTILSRLFEKEFVNRNERMQSGSQCYVYDFRDENLQETIVDNIVDDVALVLGEPGLERLESQVSEKLERRNVQNTHENN
ncbi:MAG: BlaI/MecI/CopY family transcriptional regulator [Halobacteria archaeon]|nr:BlaI/MecI/CopY family transcriptional regulator [Halobacteria archaeon]